MGKKSNLQSNPARVIDLSLLLLLFALVCGPFLYHVHQTALPGGWDGVPHYAIADLYAKRYFPDLSGWMPEYFAGMPFPNFYPPTFYVLVAACTKLGLSTRNAFLGVQTIASLAVPLLTYLCARRLADSRISGLVAGVLATGYMVAHHPLWRMGISLPSTFDAGLSTQLLGHCFLLLFLYFFFNADKHRLSAAFAALFFGLVPVTNVHQVWAAAFLFISISIARFATATSKAERLRVLGLHVAMGGVGVLVSAAWVLPMIANLRYVPTQALEPLAPGVATFAFLRLGGYLVLGSIATVSKRDPIAIAFAMGLFVLLAFNVLPWAQFLGLGDLALQPARIVVPFPFLITILIGYLVRTVKDIFEWPHAQHAAALACGAAFFAHFQIETKPEGNISEKQVVSYDDALDTLGGRHDGRVLVEMGTAGLSDPFSLQALAGASGAHAITTVFRESAINVMFAIPLRNSFSISPEAFGVDHKITSKDLATDAIDKHLHRLELFNVRYFAIQSAPMKAKLDAFPGVHRETPAGREWDIYSFDAPAPGYATVPAYEPVLTFATFSVKPRPEEGYDFVRLGEEMFAAGRLRLPLVLSPCRGLDDCTHWDRFHTVLVTEYKYQDRSRAHDALDQFSKKNHVVLLQSDDPLYMDLAKLAGTRPNIHIVHRTTVTANSVNGRRLAARKTIEEILDTLETVRIPIEHAPTVDRADLDGGIARIHLDQQPDRVIPVWIRQGYFPNWSLPDGEPVYMATPTFQLIFTRQSEIELRFERTPVEWVGRIASLLGLAAIAFVVQKHQRKR